MQNLALYDKVNDCLDFGDDILTLVFNSNLRGVATYQIINIVGDKIPFLCIMHLKLSVTLCMQSEPCLYPNETAVSMLY